MPVFHANGMHKKQVFDGEWVRVSPENFDQVAKLHRQLYGRKADIAYLRRKLENAIVPGFEWIGFIACKNGEAVSFCGGYSAAIQLGDKIHTGIQTGDYMTHPAWRGLKLSSQAGKRVENLGASLGCVLLFGLPPPSSIKIPQVNAWEMGDFYIPVKIALNAALLSRKHPEQYKKVCLFPDTELFPNSFSQTDVAHIIHSPAWRKSKKKIPWQIWQKSGWQILIRGGRDGWAADQSGQLPESGMIRELLRDLKKQGMRSLYLLFWEKDPRLKIWQEFGTLKPGFQLVYKTVNAESGLENLRMTFGDMDSF